MLLRLPIILMILVAGFQFSAANIGHLTPWKGGGFGMFAVIDSTSERTLHCSAITSDGDTVRLVQISTGNEPTAHHFNRLMDASLAMPTHRSVTAIAEYLVRWHYVPCDTSKLAMLSQYIRNNPELTAMFPTDPERPLPMLRPFNDTIPGHRQVTGIKLKSVRVELRRLVFDAHSNVVRTEMLFNADANNEYVGGRENRMRASSIK